MTPSSRPSGSNQDRPDYPGADIESGLVDLGCVSFGDVARLDATLLAKARRVILHDVQFPEQAVARYNAGRDAYDNTQGPACGNTFVHGNADD